MKPELFADEKVGSLRPVARLLFIGLITMADDEGRLRELHGAICGHIFPWDEKVTPKQVAKMLAEVADSGLILRYESGVGKYIVIRHWARHQRINRPVASALPPPPDPVIIEENSVADSGAEMPQKLRGRIPEAVRRAVARREGIEPGADAEVECSYCGRPGLMSWSSTASGRASSWVSLKGLEFDHVRPLADGGDHSEENIVLACARCNRSKGAKPAPRTSDVRNPVHVPVQNPPARSPPIPSLPIHGVLQGLTRERVTGVCSILAAIDWDVDEVGVENAIATEPDGDLERAAHLAVSWASDSTWTMGAASTFRSALRKLTSEKPASSAKARRGAALKGLMASTTEAAI